MPEILTFRIADWDTPLRVNPNRTAGRFNYEGSPATQYLALHPLTAWAEYVRNQGIRRADEIAELRLTVWTVKVRVDPLLEITFERANRHGLQPDALIADDWTDCQRFADRFRSDDSQPNAILSPSAALPGTRSLVIFEERVAIPYTWVPIDAGDCPAAVVAADARPPQALLPLVRRPGEEHAEYEAWLNGRPYYFREPPRD